MDRSGFRNILNEKILILDGATGTLLQKKGMPLGVCPELWVLDNPDKLIEIQRDYLNAGSNVVYSFTFGGNRVKLDEYGMGQRVVEINREMACLSRKAVGKNAFVAGDLAPTGRFVMPFGDMPFDEAVDIYKEQVKGLLEGGVDFFVIETMMDIQEARAALLAVKESCDLPVCASMTFQEDGRTLTGTDPVTALITLQSLGADAVGCNCSTGPEAMVEIITSMKPFAKIPLLAKPNAGLPKLIDGKTVFDMKAEEFGSYVAEFAKAGVNLLGGCCGTAPEYIEQIRNNLEGLAPIRPQGVKTGIVTSARKFVTIGHGKPVVVIGERINPTGKKKLQEELREGKTSEVRRFAIEQTEKGAEILDVNVGMPGINEKETMIRMIEVLSPLSDAPLCLDSSSPEVLEAALRIYPGRALINSISAEKIKLERLLPIAAKYGAMFIILPLNDEGVPDTAEKRYELIEQVYSKAAEFGYDKKDIAVDGLVMTVSSDQKAAKETLKVIDWCTNTFGCSTVVGLSNVSFGLPERSWVNTAFLAMAIGRGLTMAIANPSGDMIMNIKRACDVLVVNDMNSKEYIAHFSQAQISNGKAKEKQEEKSTDKKIYTAVLKGDRDTIKSLLESALNEGIRPQSIIDDILIPAITQVGQLFDSKEYYLPQLIQSAETMKIAFEYLEPMLKTETGEGAKNTVGIVLATVKGDIHDIGKNIVALMLKNYGFKVYDLGKDVDAQEIIAKVKETGAKIVGLSALMTTTMVEMGEVIRLAKSEGLSCKFMIGGAVVNDKFAEEIGADGYSEDAYAAVKLAQKLSGM